MLEPFQCEEVKIQNIDKFFPAYRTRRFYNGGHFSVLGEKDLILLCNPIQGSSLDVQKELGKRTFFLEIIGGQISPLRKIELIVTNLYPEDESQNKPDKISNKCSKKKLPNWSHRSIMTFLPHHQLGPKPTSSVRYITYLNSKWTQSLFAHVLQLKNVSEQYIRVGTSMQEPLFRYL